MGRVMPSATSAVLGLAAELKEAGRDVISLGAGNKAHGVHIISSDLFHLWEEHVPRHSRIYTDLIPIMEDVITRYMADVKSRDYPGPKETVYMDPDELHRFAKDMKWESKLAQLEK